MRRLAAVVLVAAVVSGCVATARQGQSLAPPGAPAAARSSWTPPPVPAASGRKVYSVSEAIAERDAGRLGGATFALGGYWSASGAMWSCPWPGHEAAELELYCIDGSYGITERYAPIMDVQRNGNMTSSRITDGPHLTPWIPDDLQSVLSAMTPRGPIPIVALGHFGDARASACVPEVRRTCEDRFVIESLLAFDPASAPAPPPTPAPTPFPSPPPAGLFPARQCAGDVPYSFVGWTTTDRLDATMSFEGHVWAAVTRDVVPTGTWGELPGQPGHLNLPMGRRVCVAIELDPTGMTLGVVRGTGFRLWDDGRRTSDDSYGPGSGDPSLPALGPAPSFPPMASVAMHGAGVPDATMTIRDWSGALRSARPATDAELGSPAAATGNGTSAAAAVLAADPRSVFVVWAECGSDTSGTIVVTSDRRTLLVRAASRTECRDPGARRGAVLTFETAVPRSVVALAGLP